MVRKKKPKNDLNPLMTAALLMTIYTYMFLKKLLSLQNQHKLFSFKTQTAKKTNCNSQHQTIHLFSLFCCEIMFAFCICNVALAISLHFLASFILFKLMYFNLFTRKLIQLMFLLWKHKKVEIPSAKWSSEKLYLITLTLK